MVHRRRARRVFLAALAAGLVTLAPRAGAAAEMATDPAIAGDPEADCPGRSACPGPLDVWVVSTRRLPCIGTLPASVSFDVERLSDDGDSRQWQGADQDQMLAEPGRPLVIFVHGNRYDAGDARSQGLLLARRLAERRTEGPAARVVIFSWPSQKHGLLLKDGRRKYERAYADGHYLAWLLGRVEPDRPVAIVGYSFGALVATRALADLERLAPAGVAWPERPGRTQLVFVAPALRGDALAPRGPFRASLAGLDRLTLLINSRDEALRFFPLLEPAVRVPALGLVGMPRRWLPPEVDFAATDAAGIVGKLHTMQRYLDSPSLAERIAGGALDGLVGE